MKDKCMFEEEPGQVLSAVKVNRHVCWLLAEAVGGE